MTRRSGSSIVFGKALSAPLFWIATNAGESGAVVVDKVANCRPATASTPRR